MSDANAKPIRVFSGPSVTPEEVQERLTFAVCHPPASMGDVYQAACKRPCAILLIDGYFDVEPAVWHKEILWALDQGIAVYGAASMGALRAVEMAPFGMLGIGRIFEEYRGGLLEDDDDVALLHGPPESGFVSITEAMVNVRATLENARQRKILTERTAESLRAAAKSINFRERTWSAIFRLAADSIGAQRELTRIQEWLSNNLVNQKRLDAMQAISQLSHFVERWAAETQSESNSSRQHFEINTYWRHVTALQADRLIDRHDQSMLVRQSNSGQSIPDWEELRGVVRWLLLERSRQQNVPVDAMLVAREMQDFSHRFNFKTSSDADAWIAANHLTRKELQELLHENAQIKAMLTQCLPQALKAILDELRLSGEFEKLP